MKKKKTMYVMLPLVALVWGVVFYQLFAYFFSSPVYAYQEVEKVVNIDEIKRDTFSIVANYRDPFLGKKATFRRVGNRSSTTSSSTTQKRALTKTPIKADKTWPSVIYGGMIKNNNSNWRVGIIKINGKEHLVKEGVQINDLKIIKIEKKSIEVRFQKETKTITK